MQFNYYEERKYCPCCNDYVRYLMNLFASYCVQCGGKVHLFSKSDHALFMRSLVANKAPVRRRRRRRA